MAPNVPIAIIGMSCRFAGDVDNPGKLWKLLAEGRSAWSEIPVERFNVRGFLHPNNEKLNGTNVIGGHFLKEDIGLFDASFFNLSSETAATLDPQFRLQLETTYEALESAGITLQDIAGSNTSVFAGCFFRDYYESLLRDPDSLPRFFLLGIGATMASNRLSHFFDLRGPSMTVDTGCSTTLTALHQACQSLRTGESDMSIVGGANVIFNPDMFMAMSSMTLIGKDGKSYAFDSRANGYGRGEGSATLILKRLDDALRDGDPIRAIIRETGINQDGKTETITTPSQEAQESLIRACYQRAGLDPAETTYFEAHGTGTPIGDPIEARAIASVFKETRTGECPLRIGSVKTNIGHTETVSGLAAVIKVVLALENRQIPPSINFEKPNDKIRLDEWNLKVPTELEPWPDVQGIRRASINNFGYGGSNAHVIIEDYESYLLSTSHTSNNAVPNGVRNGNGSSTVTTGHSECTKRSRVFLLSAKDEQAARHMISNFRKYLADAHTSNEDAFLDNLAYTLCHRRSVFPWILAFSGSSIRGLIQAIDSCRSSPVKTRSHPRIGFVYTGQGAQWWAMGRELIDTYPVFKLTLLQCDAELKKLGATWNMIEELSRSEETSRVNELDYSTSVCVAVQIALTELLRSWGITPSAVTSHSSGEIAAAYAAGAIDLPSAMAIAYARGGLASESDYRHVRRGGMVAVGLGAAASQPYISRVTKGTVVLACENSPNSITISGDIAGLDELEAILKQENIFVRRLKVAAAWHSHHMQGFANAYYAAMENKVRPAQDRVSIVFSSPATGSRIDDAKEIGHPAHWVRSLTGSVRFLEAFHSMCFETPDSEPSVDMVIEVGPHAALSGPIQDILAMPRFEGLSIFYGSCLIRKQNAVDTMHALVCNLVQHGYQVNLSAVNFPYGKYGLKVLHDLPTYPWNHQTRHWCEPRANRALRNRSDLPHDLLGSLFLGTNLNSPTWRHMIRLTDLPWIRDHVVQDKIIYPAAGYLSMAIEAVAYLASHSPKGEAVIGYQLRDIDILKALVVPETTEGIEVQLHLRPCNTRELDARDWLEFSIHSVTADNQWTEHCKGLISVAYADCHGWHTSFNLSQPTDETAYRNWISTREFYTNLRSRGLCYGPIFQNINSIRARNQQSLTSFSIADTQATMPRRHQHPHIIHPTTLDSVFQAAYTAVSGAGSTADTLKVPRSIRKLWIAAGINANPSHCLRAYTDLSHIDSQTMTSSIFVFEASCSGDVTSHPVITVEKLVCQSIGNAPVSQDRPWEQEKFTLIKWVPDITFLNDSWVKQNLGSEISPTEAELLIDLRRACLFYICDALSQLTASDVKGLEWYHKKFYIWMRLQVELAKTGGLGPSSKEWLLTPAHERQKLLARVRLSSTNGEMVCRLGPLIVPILRGQVTALELMLKDNLLSRYYLEGLKWGRANSKVGQLVALYAQKYSQVRIIEIGAGTGGATKHVLEAIRNSGAECSIASYDFTDVSLGFFEAAREKFNNWSEVMQYKKLDIEQDPTVQGFEEGNYDIVIACQVLHATRSMINTMTNVRKLLKPGGKLFIIETTQDQMDIQFVFGFLQGWWLSNEEERKVSPSLTISMWDNVLKQTGFRGIEAEVHDCNDDEFYSFSVISSAAARPPPQLDFEIVFVTPNCSPPDFWLDQLNVSIGLVTWTVPRVCTLEDLSDHENKICVFIDDCDSPTLVSANAAQFEGLKSMCTRSKGLLWVTRGGVSESLNPFANLTSGFLRSLRQEYSGKRLGTLDLDPVRSMWSVESIKAITDVFMQFFDQSVQDWPNDYEFSERNGIIHVPRYVKDNKRNSSVFVKTIQSPLTNFEPFLQPERPLRLTMSTIGLLDTLIFDDDPTSAEPLPEEFVEIEPRAFGVNFRDVMVAMGQLQSKVMGYDCSGVVIRVSSIAAANGYKAGDRVAVLLRGHYSSRVRVHWTSAVHMPDDMTFEVGASLPTQFVTAYLSLYDHAKLQHGESVLIHSATGGVGQAAVMLAQRVKAEVFVTVGSEEKRHFMMKQYGISPDHIFSSRDASFVTGIMEMTQGKGVNVVLNSLAGSLLQQSFDCIAPFGRFIELGKRDFELNNSLALGTFTRAVSFTSVDVTALGVLRPMHAHRILNEVVRLVASKEVNPVTPITVYPLSDVEKAFKLVQAGKHVGKIVLSVTPETVVLARPRSVHAKLRSDASYLVVGGFGGLGQSICNWLVECGAKHLLILSRNGNDKAKLMALRQELELTARGVKVTAVGCDISKHEELVKALDSYVGSGKPPIKGIIHAGMQLKDSVLKHMTLEDYKMALAPKVQGSWNLHQYFSSPGSLDFFIMLSSLIGVMGYASQSNYSAGGAFQDALARYRVEHGLPGVSIDLGIVRSVGYLAEEQANKIVESLRRHGMLELAADDVLKAIDSAIQSPFAGSLALGLNTGPRGHAEDSVLSRDLRFSNLQYREAQQERTKSRMTQAGSNDLRSKLAASTTLEEAACAVTEMIAKKLVDIFMISEDDVVPAKSLAEFGIDSLVAVELCNMLAVKAEVELSIFELMQSASIEELAKTVVTKSSHTNPDILG